MTRESADELMIRRFAGAQRDGIGRFVADSVSGRWCWSDAVFEIFGYPARSVAPSWSLIIKHVPEEDRAVAQTGYELATTRVGTFCWSHRIHVGDAMRSILVLGETSPLDGVNSLKRTGQRSVRAPGQDTRGSRSNRRSSPPTRERLDRDRRGGQRCAPAFPRGRWN